MKALILIIVFSFLLSSCRRYKEQSPRDMDGHTVLWTNDSVYFITFKIDSVVEKEQEEDYDRRP
jgi:hypothetical protein